MREGERARPHFGRYPTLVRARARVSLSDRRLLETRPATRILDSSIPTDPKADVARAVKQGRHLRSIYRCTMSSAVRMVSRTLMRFSSIPDPSDPPSRVIKPSLSGLFTTTICARLCVWDVWDARASAQIARGGML